MVWVFLNFFPKFFFKYDKKSKKKEIVIVKAKKKRMKASRTPTPNHHNCSPGSMALYVFI